MRKWVCKMSANANANVFFVIGCRIFQAVFNIGARVLPWRKATPVKGAGSIAKIPDLLRADGVAKPFVVTDPGLVKVGIAKQITDVLSAAGIDYDFYGDVEANPSVDTVEKIYAQYKAGSCDGFIAIGGGSAMDATKGAGARVARPKKTVGQLGGLLHVLRRLPATIAVATTSGTGSETTIAALITDTKAHHKYAIMDLNLIPKYAVLDPDLTKGLPPHITSTTGMDALTHAVEAYLCWTYNTKESIQFAKDAVALIFKSLERAYNDGSDLGAREDMMEASYKAGFAFTRAGVGNVHAIAHTLGGLYNTPHGLANAVILPYVLEDYGSKVYSKLAALAKVAGLTQGEGEGNGGTDEENAKLFIKEIRAMNERMGIPSGFDFIKDEDLGTMIGFATKECNPLYPVPVIYSRARYRRIIEQIRI
ncbi:MAG: iron-containing alcohol dehydrogenase [Clostridiales Family XIII bacterium]|jgi:alcohol dehydrogenase class IV|nr:iron-containing alcohol dehydrogenase [Clostridiales Family XIII bacterium]